MLISIKNGTNRKFEIGQFVGSWITFRWTSNFASKNFFLLKAIFFARTNWDQVMLQKWSTKICNLPQMGAQSNVSHSFSLCVREQNKLFLCTKRVVILVVVKNIFFWIWNLRGFFISNEILSGRPKQVSECPNKVSDVCPSIRKFFKNIRKFSLELF